MADGCHGFRDSSLLVFRHIMKSGTPTKNSRPWRRLVRWLLLLCFAAVLTVAGFLMAAVSMLPPERLTPIVEKLASESLVNARVNIDTVELSLRHSMPYMQVRVVNLSIVNTAMPRHGLPAYADTVVSLQRLEGGINMARLLRGTVALSDVTFTRPEVNAVVINDSVTNFDILPPTPDTDFDWHSLPHIEIKRFAIVNPGPLRYYDAATGTTISASLKKASINGAKRPYYALALGGNVQAPQLMRYFELRNIAFGLDGTLQWNQHTPWMLQVDNMSWALAMTRGTLSTTLNMRGGLTLQKLSAAMEPVQLQHVLNLIPAELRTEYGIPADISTDARVAASLTLTQPFVVGGSQGIPHAVLSLKLPPSKITYPPYRIDRVEADVDVNIVGDSLNQATVFLRNLCVQTSGVDVDLKGTLSYLASGDPLFDGSIKGTCNISKLPPVVAQWLPGGWSGRLDADACIKARPSMLTPQSWHRLHVHGKLSAHHLYWIGPDTVNMVYANHASLHFGTAERVRTQEGGIGDSVLTVRLHVDSAAVLHNDISMSLSNLRLGLGAKNNRHTAMAKKRDAVVPMGGKLSLGTFTLTMLTDSMTVRMRRMDGYAAIRAHNNNYRTPEVTLDMGIERFSTGSREFRYLMSNARTHVTAFLQPQGKQAERIAHLCDSVQRRHPHLSPDSVYAVALRIHNRHRSRYPRIHPVYNAADSVENIDWGASEGLKRILMHWRINGSLSAKRAGLFTPYFPLRNRLRNIDVTFNNDTMLINSAEYKAGHSDFTLSGRISNLRRAFTSTGYRSPLRVNLAMESDTIDINQLAQTAFTGSAYSARAKTRTGTGVNMLAEAETDEQRLERAVRRAVQDAPAEMKAVLIPQNIDADISVKARNILYSDLLLNNLRGNLMTYQGALNLNNLSAQSAIGHVNLSALYVGREPRDLRFGFGMQVTDFNVGRFLQLVPAVDSIMPLLRGLGGIIDADIAATTDITPSMDLSIPTLRAAIQLEGDSLVLLDPSTYKSLSRWLLFRDKDRNIINHMSVQMLVQDGRMQMFPFIFDIDRYRLGVQGTNDFAMNFNYHIAVLKSPIPFRFGINVSGNPDKYKIRLGGAKFNERTPLNVAIVDTTRINLVTNIQNIFRRGVDRARFSRLNLAPAQRAAAINLDADTLTAADSARFIREGLIPAPIKPDPQKAKKQRKK